MPTAATVPLLGIPWADVLLVGLAAVLLGSALLVVLLRDIIRAALAMMLCFAALAGIYVMLGAPLVAGAQVLIYIGAISVLILFAVMLTQAKSAPVRLVFQTQAVPAAAAAIVLAILVGIAVTATDWGAVGAVAQTVTQDLATVLFNSYVLPFEAVSVLLLVAVIGGVFLARREDRDA